MHEIIRSFGGMVLLSFVLFASSGVCGATPKSMYRFEGGRLVAISSAEELAEAKSSLLHADENHIPKGMEGGVLFDASVIRQLPSDEFGQTVWLMRPVRFLLGRESVRCETIQLVSPAIDAGGVELTPGRRYRVFTVNLEGRFYIWSAVVVELP
jgi:hypothetical protein